MKILTLILFLITSFIIKAQTLVINEISQGPSGNLEYVELVVAGTPTCSVSCMNLQHMIIDDNNGYFGTGGINAGYMRFSNSNLWKCVPYGTIIVIYKSDERNVLIPSDDFSLTDGNNTLIIPSSSSLLESTSNATYSLTSTWTTGSSTAWTNYLAMGNTSDSFQVRDSNGILLHAVSWNLNNLNTIVYFSGTAGGKVYSFKNLVDNNFNSSTNWQNQTVSGNETPGFPNSSQNSNWITTMMFINNIILGNIIHN